MQIDFIKCHGSGNDFPLVDARGLSLSEPEWATLARALADREGSVGGDGILLLVAGDSDHDFGMRMFNSDGSEAETCLNGLRCVARAGFEALGIEEATVKLKQSSADVAHAEEVAPGVYSVRTSVGPASTDASDVGLTGPISALPSTRSFIGVAMPNPHLITFVDQVDEAELVALGNWCESAPPLLPARANVSFVEMRGEDLFVRTFERGVGLTNACGSAMAASVFAAGLTGRIPWGKEVRVFNKGGLVRGSATAPADGAVVTIEGNATFERAARVEVDLERGQAGPVEPVAENGAEIAAWDAVVAGIAVSA